MDVGGRGGRGLVGVSKGPVTASIGPVGLKLLSQVFRLCCSNFEAVALNGAL